MIKAVCRRALACFFLVGAAGSTLVRANAAMGTTVRTPSSRHLQITESTEEPASSGELIPAPTPSPSAFTAPPDSTCSNGISGIESENGKTCCALYCGLCAGVGCGSRGNASDCCATEISIYGDDCSVRGAAPCFIEPEEGFVVKHSFLFFIVLFIAPFLVIALVCNNLSYFRRCFKKPDGDGEGDSESMDHMSGHNVAPQPRAKASKKAPKALVIPSKNNVAAKAVGEKDSSAVATPVSAGSLTPSYSTSRTRTFAPAAAVTDEEAGR